MSDIYAENHQKDPPEPYEAPDQDFVNMLWKWFEDRGVDLRPERSTGLTAEDFRIMLDEHEQALTDEIEKLKSSVGCNVD